MNRECPPKRKRSEKRIFTNKDVWRIYCNNLSALEQITFRHDFIASQGDCESDFEPIREVTEEITRHSRNSAVLKDALNDSLITEGFGFLLDRFLANVETSLVALDMQTTNLEIIGASIDAKMRDVEITPEQRSLVNKAFNDVTESITNSQLEAEVGVAKFSKFIDFRRESERTVRDIKSVLGLVDSLIKALGAKEGHLDGTIDLLDRLASFFKGDRIL
jgi:hypothetical protein